MQFLSGALVALVSMGTAWGPVVAQTWSVQIDQRDRSGGAGNCVRPGREEDHCLVIGCRNDTALTMYLAAPLLEPGRRDAVLSVDSQKVAEFEIDGPDERGVFSARFGRSEMLSTLEPLQAGGTYSVEIPNGGETVTFSGGLSGSSRSLAEIQSVCPLPRPDPVADPVAEARTQVESDCADFDAAAVFDDAFSRRVDIDGKPPLDLVVDLSGAECEPWVNLYCGSAGCPQSLYTATADGKFQFLTGGYMHGFERVADGNLLVHVHGTACDRVGVEVCTLVYDISQRGATLIEKR